MNYLNFCKKCIRGEIPYQKKFYVLDKRYDTSNDSGDKNLDVTVVTPTQQAVEQAKNEVKHETNINRAKKRKFDQTGGRGDVNNNKKKKYKKEIRKGNKKIKNEIGKKAEIKVPTKQYGCSSNFCIYFSPPPIDNSITKEYWVEYNPVAAIRKME